jgi:hypothetical protein
MTFKAYLDNITTRTGKSPDDFLELATKEGFIAHGKIVAKYAELMVWLKSEFGLGVGHSSAIILCLRIRTNDSKIKQMKKHPK